MLVTTATLLPTALTIHMSVDSRVNIVTEASSSPLTAEVSRRFTDAVDTEPLGVASADKPKTSIPKSSSMDIPTAAAAAGSLKASLGLGKV